MVNQTVTSFLDNAATGIQPYNPGAVTVDYQDTRFNDLKTGTATSITFNFEILSVIFL